MAGQVKGLAVNPDDLSLIPKTHMVQLLKVVLLIAHAHSAYAHTYTFK